MKLPHMSTENAIVVGVAAMLVLASLGVGGYLLYRAANPPAGKPFSQETIPGWEVFPASKENGRDRITNEQQSFSAEAPEGWTAVMTNSNLVSLARKDFLECNTTVRLGSNDGYLSASALTEQLNPPGPKPQEKHRYAGTIVVGGWPAATLTIFGHLEDVTREVDIPKGNILFIAEMHMKGLLNEQQNFVEHPRRKECEDVFEDFVAGFKIG